MSIETTTTSVDVDLVDWITGTTHAQATVKIHRNPGLYAQYEPLLAQIEAAEAEVARLTRARDKAAGRESSLDEADASPAAPAGEASLDEPTVPGLAEAREHLEDLYDRAEALAARYEADVEVWTLRALDADELAECRKDAPEAPRPASADATAKAKAAAKRAQDAYRKAWNEWVTEVNLRGIALAVLSVTVAGREVPPPTLEQLRALPGRPGGAAHFKALYEAVTKVSTQEVALPAPHRERA